MVAVMDGTLTRFVCALLFLCLGDFAAGPSPVSARERGTPTPRTAGLAAPLVRDMDGRMVLTVRIGDAGPFRFRLDTGASRTVVTSELAARLGLPFSGSTVVVAPSGRTIRPVAAVGRLAAGCLPAVDIEAAVVAAADVDPAFRIDGLIGQDVLQPHVYTLDYEAGQLRCNTAGDPVLARGERQPLSVTNGVALISLPQPRGPLHLVPDSGADRLVLFTRPGHPLHALVTPLDVVRSRTVNGQRATRRVLIQSFQIGQARLDDHEGVLMDDPGPVARMGDGLLPLHLFARVTFDAAAGYLTMEARR